MKALWGAIITPDKKTKKKRVKQLALDWKASFLKNKDCGYRISG